VQQPPTTSQHLTRFYVRSLFVCFSVLSTFYSVANIHANRARNEVLQAQEPANDDEFEEFDIFNSDDDADIDAGDPMEYDVLEPFDA
jgi:hypothetical protein